MNNRTLLLVLSAVLIAVVVSGSLQEGAASTPAMHLSEEEAINITQDYLTNTLIPNRERGLLKRYALPPPDGGQGYEIENVSANIRTEEIGRIEEPALWAVPVCFSYKIIDHYSKEGIHTHEIRCDPKSTIYVDDVTGTVIPELAKIADMSAFGCCNRSYSGVYIQFDIAAITTYYWTESDVLEDICICRNKDIRECGNKPVDLSAYNYTAEKTDNWNKSKESILNSCEGFSSIDLIELDEDEGDYFRFQISANQWSDAAVRWVNRNLVRQGGWIPLKFEKETGKIFEQRRSINSSAYAEYENTLITEHNAEKLSKDFSAWKIPPSELRNITKYDWVIKIEPEGEGTGCIVMDEKNGMEETIPGLVIWIGPILAATIVLIMYQKKKR